MHSTQIRRLPPAVVLVFLLAAGCGFRSSGPPEVGHDRGGIPDLRGARVLLLPPQVVVGGHADLERELVFALAERGGDVQWITPERMRDRLDRTPELDIAIDRLAVQPFLAGQLERYGDPLFGELYRLGVVESADLALLPFQVRERVTDDGARLEVSASLLRLRTGRVIWTGVLAGDTGPPGSLAATASAVESLARRVVP
ncbi:MAG: hypothetical protein EA351_12645 [Gemmatimonadales bacterium]|nr:MAG: hypothetical protein EA351_12645 [Gemmatimonadales bacterium]